MFSEGKNRPIPAPWNQALTRAASNGFLEGGWRARQAVPTPMSSRYEMTCHEAPAARSVATCSASTTVRGRPNFLPFALAATKPLRTRERMSSRSNSAMLAKIPNTSRPFGVEVSTPSCRLMNSMPNARNSSNPFTGTHKAGHHAFRRFRNTHLRNRTECPEGLRKFWIGHADESMSDLCDKIKEDVEFRRKWSEKCGFGFELSSVVPKCTENRGKRRSKKIRLSLFECERKNGRGERI